jgi:hypothetical protein
MIFRWILFIVFLFPMVPSYADKCRSFVALLGGDTRLGPEAQRAEVVRQLSRLYGEALNDRVSMEVVLKKMHQFAEQDGESLQGLLEEIEWMQSSPSERKVMAEALEAQRTQERSQFFEGLQPYLDRIGQAHREVIERELIASGRVNPLSTGEVGFSFNGEHSFEMGDEGTEGGNYGLLKGEEFGSGEDFAVAQVPVTQLLYFLAALEVKGVDPTPSRFKDGGEAVVLNLGGKKFSLQPNHPVENLSWDEAMDHADRVSVLMKREYGLLTEKQWEFANRAGSSGLYHFGDERTPLRNHAWYQINSGSRTHAVGELLPNPFGLYDTHGNVWEWTLTSDDHYRLARGGSWADKDFGTRSGRRDEFVCIDRRGYIGFRLGRHALGNAHPASTFRFGGTDSGSQSTAEMGDDQE